MENIKGTKKKCEIYCPACEKECGAVYCGVLYYKGNAVLGRKCPHCENDLEEEISNREDFC